ncbi:type 4a pilus biogenesis protein PilO [Ideonella azotifigens]|uniref:Type 4a pilus biogenesis protein PilO n=1 Tax=Ideonella azotifigens TaxID=513160 RepID=A0ABN1K5R0_9BURK|nr:type 4a pilus biogenesis protein PilO [Ideonella azotifigens]MCD2342428.1 type 4a pilus biogenesis protein PilO [Ideonella azotifigens]
MATQKKTSQIDVGASLRAAGGQFQGLDPKEPGQWPILPKAVVWLLAAVVAVVVGWLLLISDETDRLAQSRDLEPKLKTEYRQKLTQAVNLEELRKQKEQVQEYVTQLEKQLPGKAEMDALLSDINQAGVGRGMQFELFRPGQVVVKDYYAELPIAIRVSGRFHDIGSFAGDVANLSRIVTLHNLVITPTTAKDNSGALVMEATARTYRYLDPAEVAEVKREAAAKVSAKKKGKS